MSRFQFTLASLLWATFWGAVCATAAAALVHKPRFVADANGARVICIATMVISTYLAISCLLGPPRRRLGLAIATLCILALAIAALFRGR